MKMRRLVTVLWIVLALLSGLLPFATLPVAAQTLPTDSRFFSQTGYRIDNDRFWDYFQKRGGVATFGYPVSRAFTFQGQTVQIFQRRVIQINPDGGVGQLNILDGDLLPYPRINGATFPSDDDQLAQSAPAATSPDYASRIIDWIQAHAPDTDNGRPVNFFATFSHTVALSTAYPRGGGNQGLLRGIDLEMWGLPLSAPAVDPNNHNFVYLRFQRGIMQYDDTCQCTQGILLGDYLKAILMGDGLPADLAAEAKSSPYFAQYNPLNAGWVDRPSQLANTDLTNAFEPVVGPPSNALRHAREILTYPGTLSPEQWAFLGTAAVQAQASERTTGILASVTLGQAILDSNWGRSYLAKQGHNYFGIKAYFGPGPAGVIYVDTQEFIAGKWATEHAPFRAYHSLDESFDDHGMFLRENSRFRVAMQHRSDASTFLQLLQQAGYSTDPNYAAKVLRIIDVYHLQIYDLP